jgi:transcriptional regulator with XRE-family HTH domain
MTGNEFRQIRLGLLLTQKELATLLGYRHKVRISEYERSTNPVPVPDHVADIMRRLKATGGRVGSHGRLIRDWERAA